MSVATGRARRVISRHARSRHRPTCAALSSSTWTSARSHGLTELLDAYRELRAKHVRNDPERPEDEDYCDYCHRDWPCDMAELEADRG